MEHPLITHFQLLAHYNTLANQTLYQACDQLTETALKQIRPAFFNSIYGTLNHILIGDRIWMTRFQGQEIPSTGLDQILYANFSDLWKARIKADQSIETFFNQLTPDFLTQSIQYYNNAGHLHQDPVYILIPHFFNHQTHHRGQVHNLLSQTTVAPPSLDFHRILRPNP